MLIGGNYTGPVKERLAYQHGEEKAILDLGCGTGAWCVPNPSLGHSNLSFPCRAMDMAKDFPHCSVVGADVAPLDVG